MSTDREDQANRIRSVAELLGLSPEALIVAAANAGNAVAAVADEAEDLKPPPIVYPNVKFPRYKFREYPKIVYRGYIRDVEEPIVKFIQGDNGAMKQVNAVRVLPDQFVQETREVNSKAEEATLPRGWYLSREDAIAAAKAAKAGSRPVVERIVEDDEDAPSPMAEAHDERDALRAEAAERGIQVDKRWGAKRIRKELAAKVAA